MSAVVLRRSRTALILLVVAIGLLTFGGAASGSNVIAPNHHAAEVTAERLLHDIVLPPGSTPVPQRPASHNHQLDEPVLIPMFAADVDRHAFWTTTASPAAAVASFQSHLPAGAKAVTSFFGGGPGSGPSGPFTFAGAGYALGTRGRFEIGPEQLMVDAVLLSNGLTGVRGDAQDRYASPRPQSKRVPGSARLVQIRKTSGAKQLISVVVTSQAQVRALAHVVDGLPFANTSYRVAYSCPEFSDVTDTFFFRARAGGSVLAEVSESAYTPATPDPCTGTTVRIRGRTLAPLLDGGVLLERAGQLLGVKLTG